MILITGATGNVGRELVRQLSASGEPVRVLVRDERKLAGLNPGLERVIGDLDKPDTIVSAMEGIDQLYLVAPVTQQVVNLISAAKACGVRTIVKQSTIEANRSLGPGKWHREQEILIEETGLSWTFLRPTMMMVNTIEWWADTIKRQGAVFFPGGRGKVAPVDPRDVAAVACAVLTQDGHAEQVYELTGPEVLTIHDMVRILARVLGKHIRYVNVPALMAGMWMRNSGMPEDLVKALLETLGALRRNEYAYISNDVKRVTGTKSRGFEEWCSENTDSFA